MQSIKKRGLVSVEKPIERASLFDFSLTLRVSNLQSAIAHQSKVLESFAFCSFAHLAALLVALLIATPVRLLLSLVRSPVRSATISSPAAFGRSRCLKKLVTVRGLAAAGRRA